MTSMCVLLVLLSAIISAVPSAYEDKKLVTQWKRGSRCLKVLCSPTICTRVTRPSRGRKWQCATTCALNLCTWIARTNKTNIRIDINISVTIYYSCDWWPVVGPCNANLEPKYPKFAEQPGYSLCFSRQLLDRKSEHGMVNYTRYAKIAESLQS